MEGIQLKVENSNNISIIKVGGYIDTTTSSELEHHLTKLLERGSNNIIIDLGSVDYVSSAGWGIFISEIKGIREKGGDLKLANMIPEVYEVFELLEFHYILKAFDSLELAVKDFERSGAVAAAPTVKPASVDDEKETTTAEKDAQKQPSTLQPGGDSLESSLRKIIKTMPEAGTTQIARQLNTPEYGNYKVGWFGLRKTLKQLGLDSKRKRVAFARQSR